VPGGNGFVCFGVLDLQDWSGYPARELLESPVVQSSRGRKRVSVSLWVLDGRGLTSDGGEVQGREPRGWCAVRMRLTMQSFAGGKLVLSSQYRSEGVVFCARDGGRCESKANASDGPGVEILTEATVFGCAVGDEVRPTVESTIEKWTGRTKSERGRNPKNRQRGPKYQKTESDRLLSSRSQSSISSSRMKKRRHGTGRHIWHPVLCFCPGVQSGDSVKTSVI